MNFVKEHIITKIFFTKISAMLQVQCILFQNHEILAKEQGLFMKI